MFYKIWCVFYGTSQFALVTSQVLGLHMWPAVTVLDGTPYSAGLIYCWSTAGGPPA